MWNPSPFDCECDKAYETGEYLDMNVKSMFQSI